jgi:cell division protein FtsI/penicillin-binding protein 2
MALTAKKTDFSSNRLNLVLTVVFLLGLLLVGRLYVLQIKEGQDYTTKASRQQETYSELKSSRGQIFINNYSESLNASEPSLIATNKNFATLYAVPQDIPTDRQEALAQKLYEVFEAAQVEKQVDDFLKAEDQKGLSEELKYVDSLSLPAAEKTAKKNEITQKYSTLSSAQDWSEFRKMKRDLEINERKAVIVQAYLDKIKKPNDPYEVLQKKIAEEDLFKIYSAVLTLDGINIASNGLEIKNSILYRKGESLSGQPISFKGLGYEMVSYRFYPENNLAAHILGFVNYENVGNYGLESYYNQELIGKSGSLKSERGSGGKVIIVNDREYIKPEAGPDLVLTIDRAVEFYVCKKLEEAEARYKYDSATIIIVKPNTGEIIAMCSWPSFDPNNYADVKEAEIFSNPAISRQYEPGSVFKTITMAAALDQKKVTPSTTYNDTGQRMIEGWKKAIANSDFETAGAHGTVDMKTVLEKSLNLGAIFSMEQIGSKVFADYVQKFGFGKTTGIELSAESQGSINPLLRGSIRPIDAATASFGQGLAVTPLQMVMSYAALANGGILMKPYLVKEVIKADGTKVVTPPQELRRVVSAETAQTISAMLAEVVEKGHSKLAAVPGYYVGGKTGTAQIPSPKGGYLESQYIHTFVGYAPVDKPRFVMLVKLDKPKGFKFAESSAAPIFGEIADFLLKYYQVPKERDN